MTTQQSRSDVAKSVAAGCLVALSMPPWGWWPLAFVGIAWLHRLGTRAGTRKRAFLSGTLFGIGWLLPATAWMWFISAPGWIVVALMYALLHGAAEAVVWDIRRVSLRPLAHVLVEAVRFSWPFGGIPLASIAVSQSQSPAAPLVRIIGAIGITWFVWQLATNLVERRRHVLSLALAAIVVVAVAPTGRAIDGKPQVRIAVVQGGGPQGTRAINTKARVVHERHLDVTRQLSADERIDLVVWPENVIDVKEFAVSREYREIVSESRRLDAPFLVGVTEDAGPRNFTNEQVVVMPDGTIGDVYEKVRRVPFGEYIPMRGVLRAIGAPVDQVPHDAVAGTSTAMLTVPLSRSTISGDRVGELRIATPISWEIFFGGRVNEGVELGASVIVNPTNGSSYRGTILQTQQLAASRLRAIESGRWVVQVAPTGYSGFISNEGNVVERTRIGEPAVSIVDVPLRAGRTWYSHLGDAPFIIVLLLFFALVLRGGRRASITGR